MALYKIAVDFSGVAGMHVARNPEARLNSLHVRLDNFLHRKAGCAHVFRPCAAAAAGRASVNDHFFRFGARGACGDHRGSEGEEALATRE
jgi:hypothetical protein